MFLGTKDTHFQASWPLLTPGLELMKEEMQIREEWTFSTSPSLPQFPISPGTHRNEMDSQACCSPRSKEHQFPVVTGRAKQHHRITDRCDFLTLLNQNQEI